MKVAWRLGAAIAVATLGLTGLAGASGAGKRVEVPYVRPFTGVPGTSPHGYTPAGLASVYGWTAGGAGETIAVVDAYGSKTIRADLETFSKTFGLPFSTTTLTVEQPQGQPSATLGWGVETSLDVEWAHAVAPKAHIILVEAISATTALFSAVKYAATQAQYVSMSWGGRETATEAMFDSVFQAPGVSYFAAAGDTAGVVSYPSSSPDVVSVGGTTVTVADGVWQQTSAWSTGGGGCSLFEKPSAAQESDANFVKRCNTRGTPDISLDANPATGVAIYDSSWPTAKTATVPGPWIEVGGTSVSAVLAAAHAASLGIAVNQATVYGGVLKIAPVTTGSNGYECWPGYNLCAGLGAWNTAHGVVSKPPAPPPPPKPLKVSDIVGIGSTPTGHGYWLVGRNGDVFPFGSAHNYGSLKGTVSDVVGMTVTPDGKGYWLAQSDGVVTAYGDATFYGS